MLLWLIYYSRRSEGGEIREVWRFRRGGGFGGITPNVGEVGKEVISDLRPPQSKCGR